MALFGNSDRKKVNCDNGLCCVALAPLHWDAKRELVLTAGSAVGNRIYDACMLSHEASVDGKKLIA